MVSSNDIGLELILHHGVVCRERKIFGVRTVIMVAEAEVAHVRQEARRLQKVEGLLQPYPGHELATVERDRVRHHIAEFFHAGFSHRILSSVFVSSSGA